MKKPIWRSPRFKVHDILLHKKGDKYIVVEIPKKNDVLEYNMEAFYAYRQIGSDLIVRRCQSEMEDGRFTEVHIDKKLSIEHRNNLVFGGLFDKFDCVRDFIPFNTEDEAIESATKFFRTEEFVIVRPEIYSIKSYAKVQKKKR